MAKPRTGPDGELPDSRLASLLRAAIELIAWILTPAALWEISVPLAVLSLILLLGLSTVFTTFSGKAHGVVRVPGLVTIALFVHVAAAVISAWVLLPVPAAIVVSALAVACLITQRARWRSLLTRMPGRAGP